MLKGLFKSAWKSDSVEKRLGFITDIDVSVSTNQTILENLAVNDDDTSVRHAALMKISDPQILFNLCQSHEGIDDTNSTQLAETAFRNLIQSGELTEADFRSFLAKNPKSNLLIAKYCPLPDIQKETLLGLDESEQASIISDVAYSHTRVMVAENIHNIESLEVARKNLKGKDKNAEKIIKAKIDSFHAKQKVQLENDIIVISIREKMEALARYAEWSDEIKRKFFNLTKRWDALDFDPSEAEKEHYKKAFTTVSIDVKHNMAISLSQKNQENSVNSLEALCEKIATYPLDKLLSKSTEINTQHSDLDWQLDKESETIPFSSNISERFIKASKAIESAMTISQCVQDLRDNAGDADNKESNNANKHAKALLQATSGVIDRSIWPKVFPALESANEASLEAKSILDATQDSRKEAKDSLDNLHKKINRIFGLIKRGDLGRAQRELASVVKIASHYEGGDRKKLDGRIEELTANVSKMGDWKDFAIEPKLVDLCEQMERLPELERKSKNPSADKLAKKIKALGDTWKAFGSSDISESHWPRFKQASDIAYAPCAEFFKQRRTIQRENLEKRDPLIDRMKALFESTDWDSKLDYKSVEDSLSQIMQSWRKIKNVEHGRGQKQWEKLTTIKDQIYEKLDVEYDKNIDAKHSLTAQLDKMLEQDVTEQSLEKLQFTQSKWKLIGVTRRKQDQVAWVKFKAVSDAFYEKIQGLRQAKREVEDEQIGAYKKIHQQIHTLAKSTQDLIKSDKEFETLEVQYKALPALPSNLPEKLIERLSKEYTQACDAYAGVKDRLNKEKLDNELAKLATKAQFCAELEQLPVDIEQAVTSELEDKINSLELNNKEYIKRFATRLEKARDANREDYGKTRRLLLVECEILLDIESPKEDKDLRLQIQLDRMKEQGFGSAPIDASIKMDNFKLEWLCMPGADTKLQKKLDVRFSKLVAD